MGRRENTFRIDFSLAPKPPTYEEVHKFIAHELGLTRENVLLIQPNRRLGCFYVEVINLELAQRIVIEHDDKHELVYDGKPYKVRIEMEDGAVEVRLFDLTRSVSNEQVTNFLEAYGEVLSVRDVLWDEKLYFGGMPTGIRSARMIVLRNIPSHVSIGGEATALSYKGQRQTCSHCGEFVHTGIPCVQNKKLLVQKLSADQTYANVAKMSTQTKPVSAARHQAKPPAPVNANTNVPKKPLPTQPAPSPARIVVKSTLDNQKKSQQVLMPPPAKPTTSAPASVASALASHEQTNIQTDGNETDVSMSSQSSSSSRVTRKNQPKKKMKTAPDGNDSNQEDDPSV